MRARQDKLEFFVMDSAKVRQYDKNKDQESKSKTKTTRLTLKELKTKNDSKDEELKRTSLKRIEMLSRFKLEIYYNTGKYLYIQRDTHSDVLALA